MFSWNATSKNRGNNFFMELKVYEKLCYNFLSSAVEYKRVKGLAFGWSLPVQSFLRTPPPSLHLVIERLVKTLLRIPSLFACSLQINWKTFRTPTSIFFRFPYIISWNDTKKTKKQKISKENTKGNNYSAVYL